MEMFVSVIIPTFNRCRLLRETIESLWSQSLPPICYEILVIDNLSTDGTQEMVEELQRQSPCPLIYHRMERNLGPANSRNIGVTMARAPIIAFTDSDCRVAPDWLARGLDAFRKGENVAFVSGQTFAKPDQPLTFFSIGNPLQGENPTYPTANIFYDKKKFQEVGSFDLTVDFGQHGLWPFECCDTELAWRMKEKGYNCVYAPDVVVYHEIMRVSPRNWLIHHARFALVPYLIRRYPGLRPKLLWWGPFALADNVWFYVAVLGMLLAWPTKGVSLLLLVPFLFRACIVPERQFSIGRLPVMAGRVFFLGLRHSVISGSLIYSSIRARTLVL
jgi:glycosyltransferase involved in cell wall biosynthesis